MRPWPEHDPPLLLRLVQERRMKSFAQQGQRGLGADFHAPCGRSFIGLLAAFRATGGTAPGAIVGQLLEEHQVGSAVSLAKLIYTGQAFGFEWRDSLWLPMFQFDANDLGLKPCVQRVRAELPLLWSGWALAWWFAGSNARLDGRSPADVIDSDPNAVIWTAQSLEFGDGFALSPARRTHAVAAQA